MVNMRQAPLVFGRTEAAHAEGGDHVLSEQCEQSIEDDEARQRNSIALNEAATEAGSQPAQTREQTASHAR